MSDVSLTIGGRTYSVACEDGQESHLHALGARVDAKLAQLGGALSPQESQNLLFAALFLADDVHEAEKAAQAHAHQLEEVERTARNATGTHDALKLKIADLEHELDTLQSTHQSHAAEVDDIRTDLSRHRTMVADAEARERTLHARIAELEDQAETLAADLAGAQQAPPPLRQFALADADREELAPALERFAELLESCATKLEDGRA